MTLPLPKEAAQFLLRNRVSCCRMMASRGWEVKTREPTMLEMMELLKRGMFLAGAAGMAAVISPSAFSVPCWGKGMEAPPMTPPLLRHWAPPPIWGWLSLVSSLLEHVARAQPDCPCRHLLCPEPPWEWWWWKPQCGEELHKGHSGKEVMMEVGSLGYLGTGAKGWGAIHKHRGA